jgi:hypothetical protein
MPVEKQQKGGQNPAGVTCFNQTQSLSKQHCPKGRQSLTIESLKSTTLNYQ